MAEGEKVNPDATVELRVEMKSSKITDVVNICDCNVEVSDGVMGATLKDGEFVLFQYV